LSPEEKKAAIANAEWKPESVDTTISKIIHHKVPYGGTVGDLVDATPKDLISKVYLEDKMFETWTHGRIALIGDGMWKVKKAPSVVAVVKICIACLCTTLLWFFFPSFSKEINQVISSLGCMR